VGAASGLVIFPGALGDLICLLPTIHALSRRYPTSKFELMARAELARFALRRTPIVAGHSIDRREIALLFSERGGESSEARKFFSRFDRIECFFATDNEHFRSSLRLAARSEVSFYPFRPPGMGHVAESYLRAIGASVPQPMAATIELVPEDLCDARQRLSRLGLEPGDFVLVLPGSGSLRKNWPGENFALLAEQIQSVHHALVVLGPAENHLARLFRGRPFSVVGDTELGELAGIARLARAFIGNDSGASHLAAAAGARGLVIFGPTDPDRWRPLGNIKIIRKDPLDSLLPDEVWPAVAELIKANPNLNPR
jgi:ADP-heptose:LPS heptosyltransferase